MWGVVMAAKSAGRVGGLSRVDPRVKRMLDRSAPNRAARTSKQKRDAKRVRVRVDVPGRVKVLLARAAGERHTSSSQMGAFLLAWALVLRLGGDEEMEAYLGDHCVTSRSIKVAVDLDLDPLLEILERAADALEE